MNNTAILVEQILGGSRWLMPEAELRQIQDLASEEVGVIYGQHITAKKAKRVQFLLNELVCNKRVLDIREVQRIYRDAKKKELDDIAKREMLNNSLKQWGIGQ